MAHFTTAFLLFALAFCLSVEAQETPVQKTSKAAVSYGLVVDNSGSFRPLLDRVITVVSDVVEGNSPEDEAFLVTFVDTPKIVLRQEFTSRKADIHDAAQNMFIEGGQTAILDAVKVSADYLSKNARSDEGRLRALVLVTDGEDRESGAKVEDVIKLLKEQNIRVFVVAMADGKITGKLIDRLTKETGGKKVTPRTKAEMTAAVEEISVAIRSK
ncbi:MAG TPA: VWA domain-containing protein [Pyrinomonadaceae bacterium]